jgi:Zn-dependent peptidase ImmA (M78 family)
MSGRVPVAPKLLLWACERRGVEPLELSKRFPAVERWIAGESSPTLKQLEAFASATYTPLGYLLLHTPPEEPVPISDLRTLRDRPVHRPSPDLLDTVYLCQQRQAWYRDHALSSGESALPLVGSIRRNANIEATASRMRTELRFDLDERRSMPTWEDALRRFVEQSEELGVLVMVSGIVGVNTRRKLDPAEFRGFALCDEYAPLVFINGVDSKAAQMFTLAHELAHIWLGETALSNASASSTDGAGIERWCNEVAAELLVPRGRFLSEARRWDEPTVAVDRLARAFKVSTLVVIRRLFDVGLLDAAAMWQLYSAEATRLQGLASRGPGGGDFYAAQRARVGRRFARAVYESTWEGRSSFAEAFRLLNVKKMATFERLAEAVGVDP